VDTQNILEQTHDNKTWVLAAPLNCGNGWQKVASAKFTAAGTDLKFTFSPADTTPLQNARFYATNLLCELDQAGEFYFEITNSTTKVHMIPPAGYSADPAKWPSGPVIGLKDPVVDMSESKHTSLQSMQVLHGRGVGVLATGVVDVHIHGVTSSLHTRQGIWLHGVDSSITNCSVSAVGCAGIRAHGGNAETLAKGNLNVSGNHVHSFARWKRTYQAGIHWAGVSNSYSHNTVTDAPHNCFLGGGNEADANSTVAGVDCVFEGNVLDRCAYEAADAGAFYTCGQGGAAFVNRGNSIFNTVFKNVRNTVGTGVQTAGVTAIYLDDDMSGWNITNNTFVNCQTGVVIGGGRRNTVAGNHFERCDLAQHLDNRGMGGQPPNAVPNCTVVCEPLSSGCTCNTGAAEWMITKASAAAEWKSRFPFFKTLRTDRLGQPAYNTIAGNTFCKCGKFIDATPEDCVAWGSSVGNNSEVKTCL
jgi:parallel beta-helix repeat protein